MPTYQYRCEKCGKTFERTETISEHEAVKPQCPKCGSKKIIFVPDTNLGLYVQRFVKDKEIGRAERLGGIGDVLARQIQTLAGKETRAVVLGHLLRGGSPTSFDRLLCLRFGAAAVRALDEGESGVMVALDPPFVRYVPLEQVTGRMKSVPLDCDTMLTARDLGICFGD